MRAEPWQPGFVALPLITVELGLEPANQHEPAVAHGWPKGEVPSFFAPFVSRRGAVPRAL